MGLEEYRRKRDFTKTPEPSGRVRSAAGGRGELSFVIQKHAARRLHYDFRLELDGVLKSWAVPKGPSLDPGEKRLAVHVEDHPMDYGGFEGVIPQGQYGGGTVMLWDRGTWRPLDGDPAEAYRKGSLKFALDGEKLHGNWALVRMGGRAAREKRENWLLIKERDAVAQPGSGDAVTRELAASVDTGRTMDAIAADADRIWDGTQGELPGKPRRPMAAELPKARKGKLPARLVPQLATAASDAPEGEGWLHEIKYDGYRMLARLDDGEVTLRTRRGLDWTTKFPELAARLARLPVSSAFIDGEVVHLESDGRTSFAGLQQALSTGRTGTLAYYAFDLPYCDGVDLTAAPLEARKEALRRLVGAGDGQLRFSDHQLGRGPEIFGEACRHGLEGIVSKRRDAPYRGERSKAWLKVKCGNRQEFVIIGFSDPEGTRIGFGALILGYYDAEGRLHYAGRVGTGFDSALLGGLHKRLKRIEIAKPAILGIPKGTPIRDIHWVRPKLVGEVRFAEWTRDRVVRQAAFLGLREDKQPREVVIEPGAAAVETAEDPPAETAAPRIAIARDGSAEVSGQRLTNAEKVLYPESQITKLDLALYYERAAEWALPHLAGRPLAIVRCPDGLAGQHFYQKHPSRGMPRAIHSVEIVESEGPEQTLYVADLPGLLGLVQIGALEIHPWGSVVGKVETPDRLTFDLDPDEGLPWPRMIEAAVTMREELRLLGLESFPKTTGGKGLHVVVPFRPSLSWEEAKAFAKAVADNLARVSPQRFTTNMAKRARRGRIFIDYLRNGRGATAVGAYSGRARPGAPVSTPLTWAEVEDGVRSDKFTIRTVPDRLAALKRDPWEGFLELKQSITAKARRKVGMA